MSSYMRLEEPALNRPDRKVSLLPIVDTEAIVCHLAPLSCRAKDPNGNSTLQAMG
jgi:hypothetical protein